MAADMDQANALLELGVELATEFHAKSHLSKAAVDEYEAAVYKFLLSAFGPKHELVKHILTKRHYGTYVPPVELVGILREAIHKIRAEVATPVVDFESLLHPVVRDQAYAQFATGHYRDAVFNAIVAVFDSLRDRTGLAIDGAALATESFSLKQPRLAIADLTTESGRSDQLGFMQILQGAYSSVRNPKAHTLRDETTRDVAAQYMVFASLLARRIAEARVVAP
jgi:uncharacterized protein (TIGR02391 family)